MDETIRTTRIEKRWNGSALPQVSELHDCGSRPLLRRHSGTSFSVLVNLLPIWVIVLLALSSTCTAAILDKGQPRYDARILVDREAFAKPVTGLPREDRRAGIFARQNGGDPFGNLNGGSSSVAPTSTTKSAAASTVEASPTISNAGSSQSQAPIPANLPRAFDSPLGNNFTASSCPTFFNKFLNDPNFISCVPLSLLLNSQAFFEAETDTSTLDQVLDASCGVLATQCNDLMQSYAAQIRDSANCGDDYNNEQPLVIRAYEGLIAYLPVYQAGCLKLDSDGVSKSGKTNDYCYTSSVNNTNQADLSLYYLPVGVALPGNSRPTCSSCTQQTMSLFATAAQNLSTPLGEDYSAAAVQVNQGCGPTFVSSSVQPLAGTGGSSAASSTLTAAASTWLLTAVAGLFVLLA